MGVGGGGVKKRLNVIGAAGWAALGYLLLLHAREFVSI